MVPSSSFLKDFHDFTTLQIPLTSRRCCFLTKKKKINKIGIPIQTKSVRLLFYYFLKNVGTVFLFKLVEVRIKREYLHFLKGQSKHIERAVSPELQQKRKKKKHNCISVLYQAEIDAITQQEVKSREKLSDQNAAFVSSCKPEPAGGVWTFL